VDKTFTGSFRSIHLKNKPLWFIRSKALEMLTAHKFTVLPCDVWFIADLTVKIACEQLRRFLKPNWLSEVTKYDSNRLSTQCSNTFESTGLIEIHLKSSVVRFLVWSFQ